MTVLTEVDVKGRLEAIIGAANVFAGDDIGEHYRVDVLRKFLSTPGYMVRPATTEQVSEVMKLANELGLPVTAVGGQTGTAGGAIPSDGGIALSLERMNRIEQIDLDSMTMTVEAGCILQIAQEAVEKQGAFLPLDLGSRGSATIGGNIASNAGGNRVLRWGMMRDMVIGLEAVLADGTIVSSLTKMLKDNAGYNWKQLLIGSEGTLAVVTKAVLRLRPLPTTNQTALVATNSFENCIRLLRKLEVGTSGRLSSYELLWGDFYEVMTELQLPSRPRPMPAGYAYYILLEALGGDAESDPAQFERLLGEEIEAGTVEDAVIAQSESQRQALWAVREDFGPWIKNLKLFISYDVSMSIADMPGFVDRMRSGVIAAFPNATIMFYGHAGDGNLHAIVDAGDPDHSYSNEVDQIVFDIVSTVNGSIAAEHCVGVLRKPHLGKSRSDAELMLMHRIKAALDPRNILNPGKVLSA
jgi:FAD/FMN-containing dehydrogenase